MRIPFPFSKLRKKPVASPVQLNDLIMAMEEPRLTMTRGNIHIVIQGAPMVVSSRVARAIWRELAMIDKEALEEEEDIEF